MSLDKHEDATYYHVYFAQLGACNPCSPSLPRYMASSSCLREIVPFRKSLAKAKYLLTILLKEYTKG